MCVARLTAEINMISRRLHVLLYIKNGDTLMFSGVCVCYSSADKCDPKHIDKLGRIPVHHGSPKNVRFDLRPLRLSGFIFETARCLCQCFLWLAIDLPRSVFGSPISATSSSHHRRVVFIFEQHPIIRTELFLLKIARPLPVH